MDDNHFFRFLNSRLRNTNLSALAEELEIPKALLHDWVQARRSPSMKNMKNVKKIADHLGVSLEFLILGEAKERVIISSVSFKDNGTNYHINISKDLGS